MEGRRYSFPDFDVRQLVYPAGRRMARHDHPYSNVTAVIRGEMVEETDSAEHCGRSCSVLLKPAGTVHADAFFGRSAVATISIELAPGSPFSITEWTWAEDTDAARAAIDLRDAVRRECAEEIEASAYAMLASVLPRTQIGTGAPVWLEQLIDELQSRFDEPIRFDALAREAGLHPVYVSRAFRRFTGSSMTDYVRALRLREARHLLGSTEQPLSLVAAETGFADASHLCRAFSSAHAMTPIRFRALCGDAG